MQHRYNSDRLNKKIDHVPSIPIEFQQLSVIVNCSEPMVQIHAIGGIALTEFGTFLIA